LMNRRMRTRMSGGVRGRGLAAPSYSIMGRLGKMGRNPYFGRWPIDDDPADYFEPGPDNLMCNLRTTERRVLPCTVTVGGFVVNDVYFPREKTAARIKEMARETVAVYGRRDHEGYPVPKGVKERYVQYFRYCIAKLLAGERGGMR
ncbi:hypothetical protein V3F56_06165, partial [Moorellaceae bacterium AZ2]